MPRPPKVKLTYVMERENAEKVRALAKRLGVTQSEIMNCLVEYTDDNQNEIINRIADKLQKRADRLRSMANPKSSRSGMNMSA